MPLTALTVRPLDSRRILLAALSDTVPEAVALEPSAVRPASSVRPPDRARILALMVTLFAARSVRSLEVTQLISLATVILPASASADDPVVTTTLLASRRLRMVDTVRMDPDAEASVPVTPVSEPVAWIVRLFGSSSSVPVLPAAARRSTDPVKSSNCLPDTSTKPPSPLSAPPRAETLPANWVFLSDHITTLPPLPAVRASALIEAPASTVVVRAFRRSGDAPWKPPPMSTTPPPVLPDASTNAPLPTNTSPPVIAIWPPAPERF